MTRSILALAAILAGTACPGKPQTTLHLLPPKSGCVGVVGFVATIGGAVPSERVEMRKTPVLAEDQCALEQPITVPDVGVDTPLSVTLYAYDSQERARVYGNAKVGTLDAPEQTVLSLIPAWDPVEPVLVVHRASVLGVIALADVTRMEIRTTGNQPLVDVSLAPDIRPFFEATDPFAFAYPFDIKLMEGQALTVIVTAAQKAPPVKLTASDMGAYFLGQ